MTDDQTDEIGPDELDRVKTALASKGVRVNIGGCGCCGSPWVKIEVDGVVIMDTEFTDITMIEGE